MSFFKNKQSYGSHSTARTDKKTGLISIELGKLGHLDDRKLFGREGVADIECQLVGGIPQRTDRFDAIGRVLCL
jgi:hypothetical protein